MCVACGGGDCMLPTDGCHYYDKVFDPCTGTFPNIADAVMMDSPVCAMEGACVLLTDKYDHACSDADCYNYYDDCDFTGRTMCKKCEGVDSLNIRYKGGLQLKSSGSGWEFCNPTGPCGKQHALLDFSEFFLT